MFSSYVRYGIWALVSLLGVGMVWLMVTQYLADSRALAAVTPPAPVAAAVAAPAPVAPEPAAKPRAELAVHVAGAVARPDVYRLEQGARISDAIAAAGGALPEGMPDMLNLAAVLADGEKIYVPTRQEAQLQAGPAAPAAVGATRQPVQAQKPHTTAATPGAGGKIALNTATQKDLEAIGVFPATAKTMVDRVKQQGPFKSWEEVDAFKGVGEATLEKLKAHTHL